MNKMENRLFAISLDDLRSVIHDEILAAMAEYFKQPNEEKLLTISQAAAMLEVDSSTLWHWDKEGYLKKIHIGGKPRYKESEVLAILDGKTRKQ